MELARNLTHQLREPTLDGAVHVLVDVGPDERITGSLVGDTHQALRQDLGLVIGEETHPPEHRHVGQRPLDVHVQQPAVGCVDGEGPQLRRRTSVEPAARPQAHEQPRSEGATNGELTTDT